MAKFKAFPSIYKSFINKFVAFKIITVKNLIGPLPASSRQKEACSRIIFHSLRQKYERSEQEKLEKMREREERRKKKQLAKLMQKDNVNLNGKVAEEQKKLLKAQKKLQAIRLIEELFMRIEVSYPRSDFS